MLIGIFMSCISLVFPISLRVPKHIEFEIRFWLLFLHRSLSMGPDNIFNPRPLFPFSPSFHCRLCVSFRDLPLGQLSIFVFFFARRLRKTWPEANPPPEFSYISSALPADSQSANTMQLSSFPGWLVSCYLPDRYSVRLIRDLVTGWCWETYAR